MPHDTLAYCIGGIAVKDGVWLTTTETKISAALWPHVAQEVLYYTDAESN